MSCHREPPPIPTRLSRIHWEFTAVFTMELEVHTSEEYYRHECQSIGKLPSRLHWCSRGSRWRL
jgi:hypothetical protein